VKAQSSGARQLGGFAMGLIVGLLLGLILALGVALYVTKVPVPFVNKVPQRTAEQDAAEAEKNKHWDPNSGLAGKPVAKPPFAPVGSASQPTPAGQAREAATNTAKPERDPAAILAGQPVAPPSSAPRSTNQSAEPFVYFVQAGAYMRVEEAEQQRARLAMQGMVAKVTEREQSGRTVYRVRLGPFDQKTEAGTAQANLQAAGIDAVLVRVFR